MPILNVRANTVGATSGTTWANTANAVDGTYGTNNATNATWTNATSNAVGYIELGFGTLISSALPANAVINSVTLNLRQLVNNTGRISSLVYQAYDGSTALSTSKTCTLATAARNDTHTPTLTRAQLVSSTFKVRITATKAANTQSLVLSIDYIDISINYTVPPVASFTANRITINQGETVQFTDTSTNGPTGWVWNCGAGGPVVPPDTQNPLVTFPTPGNYSVTLTASNSAGSNQSAPTVITVNAVTQKNKIWNGTSFRSDAKIWNGTSWRSDWKVWNGTSWQ